MNNTQRLALVKSMVTDKKFYDVRDVRPFYFALSELATVIMYYIVPIKTVTMGLVNAHVSADTGQVIAFKSGRGVNYHVARVKRGYLDPIVISIVDNAITKMAR